jgi:hypothetical protein
MNAYLAILGGIGNFSPLLTYALIKLEPNDCNSPSKHAMNAEMHKCRSFKIIASRLKRCSS